jgi:hypothetical protein
MIPCKLRATRLGLRLLSTTWMAQRRVEMRFAAFLTFGGWGTFDAVLLAPPLVPCGGNVSLYSTRVSAYAVCYGPFTVLFADYAPHVYSISTLTPQSRIDVDSVLRQPDALDWVQRHWPSVDAAVGAAMEEAERYVSLTRPPLRLRSPPGSF